MTKKKIKVCYVLAYRAPDYIRTRVLVRALEDISEIELYTAINTRKGTLRYIETLLKTLYIRLKHDPDVYLLGFRGQEIFWPVRLISFRKKLVFDEFVNMYNWLTVEKRIIKSPLLARLAKGFNGSLLKRADLVLADTALNAEYSAKAHGVDPNKFAAVYVGADENIFYPRKGKTAGDSLHVFFYGTMLPLHGVEHILGAARLLKGEKIRLTLVGAGKKGDYIKDKINKWGLENVRYIDWVKFENIPKMISEADLCLGGPFGDTPQAGRVITGKTFQFLAMAKPTVISRTEDSGFKDRQNVVFCERGSAESLAGALKWALANKDKLGGIGKNGHRLYMQKFSEKQVKVQLAEALNRF
ncbi:MAG TPA: glycosyltransferase [Candidatus Saccharimonadales bacterium]|nr:glycosyltransferase [Candidatus Saccharimonadales bacterium]